MWQKAHLGIIMGHAQMWIRPSAGSTAFSSIHRSKAMFVDNLVGSVIQLLLL